MHKKILPIILITLTVAGCSGGGLLENKAPDDLAVVDGPPLTLPPDFALRPPKPGESDPLEFRREEARKLITGSEGAGAAPAAGDDAWLLKQAGADRRDPTVREKLEDDFHVTTQEEEKGWFSRQTDSLFGGDDKPLAPVEPVAPSAGGVSPTAP